MKATQGAPEFSLAVGQLLVAVRQLVRAEYAEIFLFPAGLQQGLRSTLGAQGEMTAHADVASPADAAGRSRRSGPGQTRSCSPAGRAPHPLDGYLAARSCPTRSSQRYAARTASSACSSSATAPATSSPSTATTGACSRRSSATRA